MPFARSGGFYTHMRKAKRFFQGATEGLFLFNEIQFGKGESYA